MKVRLLFVFALLIVSVSNGAVPVLTMPANGSTYMSNSVGLYWNYSAYASYYNYEMDVVPTFNSPALKTGRSNNSTKIVVINGLEFGQQYYWRIAAVNGTTVSGWSSYYSFTVGKSVDLVAPANNTANVGTQVNLDWTTLTGTDWYWYELDTNASFNSGAKISGTQSGGISKVTVSNVPSCATFYWRVKCVKSNVSYDWSAVGSFATACSMQLKSPTDNSTLMNTSPALKWNKYYVSTNYIYQLDTTPAFNSSLLKEEKSSDESDSVVVQNLLNSTKYYWRVASYNANTNDTTAWSATWNFTTEDIGTSVKEIGTEISVFPNPFQQKINLITDREIKLEIFDALGNSVFSNFYSKGLHNIDLDYLQKGVYFMFINSDDAITFSKTLVCN